MRAQRRSLSLALLSFLAAFGLVGCAEYKLPTNTPDRAQRPSGYYGLAKATAPTAEPERERALDPWLRGKKRLTRRSGPRSGDVSDPSNQKGGDWQSSEPEKRAADEAFDDSRESSVYVVQPGENLFSVARKHGVSAAELAQVNRIDDPSQIRAGTRLTIPSITRERETSSRAETSGGSSGGAAMQGTFHVVKKGDTVLSLARLYGVNTRDIEHWNPSEVSRGLPPGCTVYVPKCTRSAKRPRGSTIAKVPSKASIIRQNPQATKVASFRAEGVTEKASFIWPVSGRLLSKFGQRSGRAHTGIDICAEQGTIIRAAMGGKVIYSGVMKGYGNVIILDHQNGYFTVYGHNEKNRAYRGTSTSPMFVKRGQIIATVGQTGNATSPHLHFEIRRSNDAINPLPLLPKRSTGPVASRLQPASPRGSVTGRA